MAQSASDRPSAVRGIVDDAAGAHDGFGKESSNGIGTFRYDQLLNVADESVAKGFFSFVGKTMAVVVGTIHSQYEIKRYWEFLMKPG